MNDDSNKADRFDAYGEEIGGYVSLEQARVMAERDAIEHPELAGSLYRDGRLVFDVESEDEGEDYYYLVLSVQPVSKFKGKPGAVRYTIDKMGRIETRQVVREPTGKKRTLPVLFGVVVPLTLVAGMAVAVFNFGVGAFGLPAKTNLQPVPPVASAISLTDTVTATVAPVAPVAQLPEPAQTSIRSPGVPNHVSLSLQDPRGSGAYAFGPSDLNFNVGDTVRFRLTAETEFHTFTVDDLGIDVMLNGGETVTFDYIFYQAGTYSLICIPHEFLGMTGSITVR